MKSRLLFTALALGVTMLSACNSQSGPVKYVEHRSYPIEHAHVHYVYSGFGRGVEDLYFDQYGKRELKLVNWQHIEDEKFRPFMSTTLTIGSDVYSMRPGQESGLHWKDPVLDSLLHLTVADSLGPAETARRQLASNGKLIGHDTVAGMPTEIWKPEGAPVHLHVWKGILLEREVVAATDSVRMIAVSVDTSHMIDPQTFAVPKFKFEEGQPPKKKQ